jgi:hypothetical protein
MGNSVAMEAANDTANERETATKVPEGSNETKLQIMSFDVGSFAALGLSFRVIVSGGVRIFTKNCGVNSLSEGMSIIRLAIRFCLGADVAAKARRR